MCKLALMFLALFIACVGSGYAQRVVLPLPPEDPLI
jgi:hypothetical protein